MAIFLAVAVFERLRTVRALRRANQDLSQRIAERSQQSQVADQRLLRRGQVIAELTSAQYLETEPLERVIKRIAEGAAREIGVERTSIWRYNAERTQIVCEDLFELATGRHSGGAKATLARANYPSYFAAIDSKDIVAASDARTDPRTVEFTESYLNPLGIGAMLDTPIMLAGKVEGVVCLEHVGAVREWNAEDVIFAVALSNVVA
ncbi:MAG: GAF domain-containing protein, partial [Burkholderiales bacterium]